MDLRLDSAGLGNWSVVAAVSRLTALQSLALRPHKDVQPQLTASVLHELSCLTGLTCLSLLVCGSGLSDTEVQQFHQAMPGLLSISG